jgi:hypothetical protein
MLNNTLRMQLSAKRKLKNTLPRLRSSSKRQKATAMMTKLTIKLLRILLTKLKNRQAKLFYSRLRSWKLSLVSKNSQGK